MTTGAWRLTVLLAAVLAGPVAGSWMVASWMLSPDLAGLASPADWGARAFLRAFDIAAVVLAPPAAVAVRIAARRLSSR